MRSVLEINRMDALRNSVWRRAAVLFTAAVFLVTALFAAGVPREAKAASHTFTVYLQAGHSPSAYGVGNTQGGIRESVLNEQVTIKTFNALRARGINVLLLNPITLDSSLPSVIKDRPAKNEQYSYYSPEPAMLTALTWPERFDSSLTDQADLVITLHHNGYGNTSVRGYEIYYSSTVGGEYGRTAEDVEGSRNLAKLIEAEFKKGFHIPSRSPAVRDNSTNNGLTKAAPMASVLVEAGYMSNAQDLAAIRSESNQQSMADKIADAVVNYKTKYYSESDYVDIRASSATATYSKDTDSISVKTTLTPAESVAAASMKVWPLSQGESALQTYDLRSEGGASFSARIGLEPFSYASGTYQIMIYGEDKKGRTQLAGSATVNVTGPSGTISIGSVTARLVSTKSNAALLTAKDVTAPGGVAKVEFATWSNTNGQDDVKWYTATQKNDTWVATMRTTDLLDRPGEYSVHAYVTDARGNRELAGQTSVVFSHKEGDVPELYGELTYRRIGTKLILNTSDVRDASGVKGVRYALWSTASEQQDMQWFNASKSGTTWSAVADLTKYEAADERYTVHVYAEDALGNDGRIAALTFRLVTDREFPEAEAVSVVEQADGTGIIYIDGVKDDKSGVSNVEAAVWTTRNNQDDLKWYRTEDAGNGTWTAVLNPENHNGEKGPYRISVYTTDAAGNRGLAARALFAFGAQKDRTPPGAAEVKTDQSVYNGQTAKVSVCGVEDPSGISSVRVEVTGADANGRDSVKKYPATAGTDDVWTAELNWGNDFSSSGKYVIKAYATDRAGNEGLVGQTSVTVGETAIGGFPIMGESEATVAQLVNMQLASGWSNSWYRMTVLEFCQMYYDICEAEGVKAEVAYAQMLHETASLKYGNLVVREQLNFAGLGSTGLSVPEANRKSTHRYTSDGRDAGIVFASVENGIRSQVQHLKGYASTEELKLPIVPEYDRFGYMERGSAPTIQLLSKKWATNEKYGDHLYDFVEKILSQSTEMPKIDTAIPAATATPAPSAKPGTSGAAIDVPDPEAALPESAEPAQTAAAYVAPNPVSDQEPETEASADTKQAENQLADKTEE